MPQGLAPAEQLVEPTFWMASQLICEVLRAVMILSSASFASSLAIISCCDVRVEDMASPNTPSRLTIPTVSMAIEITTSSSENPPSARFAAREPFPLPIIDVAIDNSPKCHRAANHERDPFRPTTLLPANSASLRYARCTQRLHSRLPHNWRQPAMNHLGRSK